VIDMGKVLSITRCRAMEALGSVRIHRSTCRSHREVKIGAAEWYAFIKLTASLHMYIWRGSSSHLSLVSTGANCAILLSKRKKMGTSRPYPKAAVHVDSPRGSGHFPCDCCNRARSPMSGKIHATEKSNRRLDRSAIANYCESTFRAVTLSPPESMHALNIDALRQPNITFWSVWTERKLAGCEL